MWQHECDNLQMRWASTLLKMMLHRHFWASTITATHIKIVIIIHTSSSKRHAWFTSCCPGRHLSTWPTTAVSCSTTLCALCGQLTFLTCVLPRTLSSYGDRTFAAAGPRLWNSLPVQLHNPDITYGLFWRQLKGHLFPKARTRRSVTSDMWSHRKTGTCLLTSPGTCHTTESGDPWQLEVGPAAVTQNLL